VIILECELESSWCFAMKLTPFADLNELVSAPKDDRIGDAVVAIVAPLGG